MNEKKKPRPKVRGNGMGCAFQRKGHTDWTVEVVVGWKYPDGDVTKPKRKVTKKLSGFPTKKAALDHVKKLQMCGNERIPMSLEDVWLAWKSFYEKRIDDSTMKCYIAAYKHFSTLHGVHIDRIGPDDLQRCIDSCPAGKRTHQNMRTTAGLLWHYAIDNNIIDRDITQNLYTGKGKSVQREALTQAEENVIEKAIGSERYAEYIYCLLWLGYRPGEFLELRKDQLFCANIAEEQTDKPILVWYFINGKKTEAGRNRIVPVPDKILPIILNQAFIPGTSLLFPQYQFSRKQKDKSHEFVGFKQMTDRYFRETIFKPMMSRLGIAKGKVPYGTRHSYANKLKKGVGTDGDKAKLIGHTDYAFTQSAYQTADLADLKKLVESM